MVVHVYQQQPVLLALSTTKAHVERVTSSVAKVCSGRFPQWQNHRGMHFLPHARFEAVCDTYTIYACMPIRTGAIMFNFLKKLYTIFLNVDKFLQPGMKKSNV